MQMLLVKFSAFSSDLKAIYLRKKGLHVLDNIYLVS